MAAEFWYPPEPRVLDPAAVTFYDDPVTLAARPVLDTRRCPDVTPRDGGPTVFMSRDNPSLYHLIRFALPETFIRSWEPRIRLEWHLHLRHKGCDHLCCGRQ